MRRPAGFIHSGTISISDFRSQPGEYFLAVERARQSFVLARNGKPFARLVPMDDTALVLPDGTVLGEPPVTSLLAAVEANDRIERKVGP